MKEIRIGIGWFMELNVYKCYVTVLDELDCWDVLIEQTFSGGFNVKVDQFS